MSKDKVRLYELAKKYGMPSKKLIEDVKALGVQVKSHMCIIEEDTIARLNRMFMPSTAKKVQKTDSKTPEKINKPAEHKTQQAASQKPTVEKKPFQKAKVNRTVPPKSDDKPKTGFRHNPRPPGQRRRSRQDELRKKANKLRNKQENAVVQEEEKIELLELSGPISVKDFAERTRQKTGEVQKAIIKMGHMFSLNQVMSIDFATKVGKTFEIEVSEVSAPEKVANVKRDGEEQGNMIERPPIVTVMGHVDHGKTSLLDRIREASVSSGEAGGITQHIGAYLVSTPNGDITFLDTPGHEAFTAMRARGAQITDIVILVVAADDGVKPQTVEALNHAKESKATVIVAVNKIDKPGADREKARRELGALDLIPEVWGGDTIFVDVSAKTGEGITELLEMILLQAEVMELKANPECSAEGIVVESTLDKQRGTTVTVLIQSGTLKVGDSIVCGSVWGKVRAMLNDNGKKIKTALPSCPVEILGLSDVPMVGDLLSVTGDEKEARVISDERSSKDRDAYLSKPGRVSLQSFHEQIEAGSVKELKIIVKGDVLGSVQAVCDTLSKLPLDKVVLKVIHNSVGAITETDIILASASSAIVVGFNVRPENKASALAEAEGVDIRLYSVIYSLVDDVKKAMVGVLEPTYTEKVIGKAEIREVFSVPKLGKIGGCFITNGKITRNAMFHLLRDNVVIFTGKIASLRRFKEDAKDVASGYECGIGLENYSDIKIGDVIEGYIIEETKASSL